MAHNLISPLIYSQQYHFLLVIRQVLIKSCFKRDMLTCFTLPATRSTGPGDQQDQ